MEKNKREDRLITFINEKQRISFLSRIQKTDSCWIWRGQSGKDGRGYFKVNNIVATAHRVYFVNFIGPTNDNYVVRTCDHSKCVNPDHLKLVDKEGLSAFMTEKNKAMYLKVNPCLKCGCEFRYKSTGDCIKCKRNAVKKSAHRQSSVALNQPKHALEEGKAKIPVFLKRVLPTSDSILPTGSR